MRFYYLALFNYLNAFLPNKTVNLLSVLRTMVLSILYLSEMWRGQGQGQKKVVFILLKLQYPLTYSQISQDHIRTSCFAFIFSLIQSL